MVDQNLRNTGNIEIQLRLWDAEGNRASLELEYWDVAAGVWVQVDGLLYQGQAVTAETRFDTSQAGTLYSLVWNPSANLALNLPPDLRFRVRASDRTGIGNWSEELNIPVEDTPFNIWRKAHFPDAQLLHPGLSNALGHADNDFIANLVEYGLAGDPLNSTGVNGLSQLPKLQPEQDGTLRYVFRRPEEAPVDLITKVQVSESMAPDSWTTVATKTGDGAWSGTAVVDEAAPEDGRVEVRVTISSTGAESRRFVRTHFELVPPEGP
jgi:hypothetical protein